MRDRDTFEQLRVSSARARSGPVVVTAAGGGEPSTPPRLAFGVGRAVGPAVVRNRLRRRVRSIVREGAAQGRVAPGTALLVRLDADAAGLTFRRLKEHVEVAVRKAQDRLG